jgi:DNA mismatch repair protein MLH3
MSIKPLPTEVVAQITSTTTITSLVGVVCELIKNALDAYAETISVTVDFSRGSCMVEDDGVGILPLDFEESGGLGKMHRARVSRLSFITG